MSTALLVIDAQESFRARGEWADVCDPSVADRIDELVSAARRRAEPVFWLLHTEPGTGNPFDPALGHVRLMDALKPNDGEAVIAKTSINAFTSTDLESRLRCIGVERVAICGIRTEQCCETTARLAADLGFEVVFITEATTTTGLADLTATEVIGRTEAVLSGRGFATISTVAEFVAEANSVSAADNESGG